MKWFFLVLACLFLYVANEQRDKRDVPNYQNLGLVFLGDLREYNYSVDDGVHIYETYATINGKDLKLINGKDWSTGGSLKVPSKVYLFKIGTEQYFLGSSDVISLNEWEKGSNISFWVSMSIAIIFFLLFFYFFLTKDDKY